MTYSAGLLFPFVSKNNMSNMSTIIQMLPHRGTIVMLSIIYVVYNLQGEDTLNAID